MQEHLYAVLAVVPWQVRGIQLVQQAPLQVTGHTLRDMAQKRSLT